MVGDPDGAAVELFVGDTPMTNDSPVVIYRTWSKQNVESQFYNHSYTIKPNDMLHMTRSSDEWDTNSAQSCFAQINIDNKVNRDTSIFNRDYTVLMGARKYASDTDTDFTGFPENAFDWTFGEEPLYNFPPPPPPPVEEVEEQSLYEETPEEEDDSGSTVSAIAGVIVSSAALLTF